MGGREPAARRDGSFWAVAGALVAVVATVLLVDARTGAYLLAGVLAIAAVLRAARPAPGPAALSVRARWLDATVLATFAGTVAILATIVPDA